MKQKVFLIPLLFVAIVTMAETSLIIKPLVGEEQARALSAIGYVKVTPDYLFVYSHNDLLIVKAAIKDIRHIRYGELGSPATSIEDIASSSTCRIYPNPTQDLLVIDNADCETAYVFDLGGHLLNKVDIQSGNAAINVSSLPQGQYLLLLNTQTYKFIKH